MIQWVKKYRVYFLSASVFLFSFGLYLNSIHKNFVSDDAVFFEENSIYLGSDGVMNALTKPFVLFSGYFRPAVLWTYAFFGTDVDGGAGGQHLINVLIFSVCAVLVFLCSLLVSCARLRGDGGSAPAVEKTRAVWLSLVGGVFFASHPLMVESVAWISGRFDLMMAMFLLFFVFFDFFLKKNGVLKFVLLGLVYFLAACSKEMAAVFPLAYLVIYYVVWRGGAFREEGFFGFLKNRLLSFWAILIGGVLYLIARYLVTGGLLPGQFLDFSGQGGCILCRPYYASCAALRYFKLVFFPYLISREGFDFPDGGLVTAAGIFLIAFVPLFVWYVGKKTLVIFPFLVFVLMTLPVLHFVVVAIGDQFIAERFAVAPFSLMIVSAVPLMTKEGYSVVARLSGFTRKLAGVVAGAAVLINCVLVFQLIPFWSSTGAIYTLKFKSSPDSMYARELYKKHLISEFRYEEAIPLIENDINALKSRNIYPFDDYESLMHMYTDKGDLSKAKEINETLIGYALGSDARRGRLPVLYWTRQVIEKGEGDEVAAIVFAEKALALDPGIVECRMLYADSLYRAGRKEEAFAIRDSFLASPVVRARQRMKIISDAWGE